MLFYFQLVSALLCAFAACWNFLQASTYMKKRRDLDKHYQPVARVITHVNGERQLGILGTLPEPGTTLYVLKPPDAKAPAPKVIHA